MPVLILARHAIRQGFFVFFDRTVDIPFPAPDDRSCSRIVGLGWQNICFVYQPRNKYNQTYRNRINQRSVFNNSSPSVVRIIRVPIRIIRIAI